MDTVPYQIEPVCDGSNELRLNLGDKDLAYRFGMHQSTISRRFKIWIEVMFVRLKPMIKWPDHAVVTRTLPMVFTSHFKKCICIIDCFEVFCDRPTGLKARAQTYSQYKHHNTMKFLIGITPQDLYLLSLRDGVVECLTSI